MPCKRGRGLVSRLTLCSIHILVEYIISIFEIVGYFQHMSSGNFQEVYSTAKLSSFSSFSKERIKEVLERLQKLWTGPARRILRKI